MNRLLTGAVVLAICLGAAAPADAASPWKVVTSPSVGSNDNQLNAVAAISKTNAYAVGSDGAPLVEHWNGTKWSVVTSLPSTGGLLSDISAPSASDVWVDGSDGSGKPLLEHYNGSQWTRVAAPPKAWDIAGVSASSPANVWVEALTSDALGNETIWLARWNGTTWSKHKMDTVNPDEGLQPDSVKAFSKSDVWVLYGVETTDGSFWNTDHWTGSAFTGGINQLLVGDDISTANTMHQLAATSDSDLWEAGSWYGYNFNSTMWQEGPVAGRLVGSSWADSPLPNAYLSCCHDFYAIAPASPTSVWAVGQRTSGSNTYNLLENWNGASWTEWGGPNPTTQNQLLGVASVPGVSNQWWAVGWTGASPARTEIMHCC